MLKSHQLNTCLKYKKRSGATLTVGTGPTGDHTTPAGSKLKYSSFFKNIWRFKEPKKIYCFQIVISYLEAEMFITYRTRGSDIYRTFSVSCFAS
jgi:hypothetical protein